MICSYSLAPKYNNSRYRFAYYTYLLLPPTQSLIHSSCKQKSQQHHYFVSYITTLSLSSWLRVGTRIDFDWHHHHHQQQQKRYTTSKSFVSSNKSPYVVLQLTKSATKAEIKSQFIKVFSI